MTIRHLYGEDGQVGGRRWAIFMMENPTEDEQARWWQAMDALFPPAMPEPSEGGES